MPDMYCVLRILLLVWGVTPVCCGAKLQPQTDMLARKPETESLVGKPQTPKKTLVAKGPTLEAQH